MIELESRLTPSAYDWGGGMVYSKGINFIPFPDWHGPLNLAEGIYLGQDIIAVGAGQGGGPRLGLFNLHGVRIAPDRFVGDPNSREGLVPLIMDSQTISGGVPYDLSQKGVRLLGTTTPPDSVWIDLRNQLNQINSTLINQFLQVGGVINVLYNEPITDYPLISNLAGTRVDKYGPDSTTTYDGITGLTLGPDIVIKLGSDALIHEFGHVFDNMINHGASMQPDWQYIWKYSQWSSDYFKLNYDEAWAESFARIVTKQPVQDAVAAYFFSKYGLGDN